MTRTPAHPGAHVQPLQFHELDDDWATRLRDATGAQRVERAVHPAHPPQGYYRLIGGRLSSPVFAKVFPRSRLSREAPACDLANRAARAGLPTLHALSDAWVLDEAHQVLCWPWMEGHFSSGLDVELAQLGRSLRDLHQFLAALSGPNWEARGRECRQATWNTLEQLALAVDGADEVVRALQWLLKNHPRVEVELSADAQPVHDDLHRGNVLFDDQGQVLAFLDFEEALDAFASPWLDLSWVTERFCTGSDMSSTQAKVCRLLSAYQGVEVDVPSSPVEARLGVLGLWRNLRALALLHRMESRTPHWQDEWDKFRRMVSIHLGVIDRHGL